MVSFYCLVQINSDFDESWWRNDGQVNVRSQAGPTVVSNDKIVDFDGTYHSAVYNFMGVSDGYGT